MEGKVNYDIPFFRVKKLGEKFLVSNDLGNWSLLSSKEFHLFSSYSLEKDPKFFKKMLDAGMIFTNSTVHTVGDMAAKRMWHLLNGTSLHVIAVTNECNLGCVYCYSNAKNKQKMSTDTAKKTAEFIFQSPAKNIVVEFSGGEPLLNFGAIKKIVDVSKKLAEKKGKNIGFSIINNGTQWSDEKMKFFVENKVGVCFSLDGPKKLHNLHRRYLSGGGTYDDVVRCIKKFRAIDYPHLNALPVITKHSLPHWKEIIDEYDSLGFKRIRFKYLGYFGRASEIWDELGYPPEAFVDAWKKVVEYIFELNTSGKHLIEGMAEIIAKKLYAGIEPGYCELQMPCGAGISQLAYSPDGSVYTCDEGRMFEEFKVCTVDQKFSKAINNDTVKGLAVASSGFVNLCDRCALKPFCGLCPIEAYKMSGDIMSRLPFDRRCRTHGKMVEFLIKRADEDADFEKMLRSWAEPPKKQ